MFKINANNAVWTEWVKYTGYKSIEKSEKTLTQQP